MGHTLHEGQAVDRWDKPICCPHSFPSGRSIDVYICSLQRQRSALLDCKISKSCEDIGKLMQGNHEKEILLQINQLVQLITEKLAVQQNNLDQKESMIVSFSRMNFYGIIPKKKRII